MSCCNSTEVWVAPEMVDFAQRITVSVSSRSTVKEIEPKSSPLLEDVRTRGDRQHPFWAVVE